MRFTHLFTKTTKANPKDETSKNAQLLERGGFISKTMAGVYVYLPLGLKVLDKINAIIRDEMNKTGAEELLMTVLQNKDTWATTGRWESANEVMYQFKDSNGKEIGLGWTHEEPLTEIARHFISSHKDLPKMVYQIQTKFRNEVRARSGLIRGREFLMKDLYSFHASEEDLSRYYEIVAQAYENIFRRCRLPARRTLASGGLFSKFSDEFQVLTDAGEDSIYYCTKCRYTTNRDIAEDIQLKNKCPECGGEIKLGRSIEVGNIFKLGTKFSEAFALTFTDQLGNKKPVIMASYGIGPGRVMGTVVELNNDDKGIIWPETLAPFKIHLIALEGGEKAGDEIYQAVEKSGAEIIYDDRSDKTAGEKFADADLIGCPIRIVASKKTLEKQAVELKWRVKTDTQFIPLTGLEDMLECNYPS